MAKGQATMQIRLPFEIVKKKKWFFASCTILDVHTQGATFEVAKNNLAEALTEFLITCFEMGTLFHFTCLPTAITAEDATHNARTLESS